MKSAATYAAENGMTEDQVIAAQEQYIAAYSKSQVMAFFLAFLFGPVGALYGTVLGGAILIFLTFAAVFTDHISGFFVAYSAMSPFGLFFIWVVWAASLIVATMGAGSHNKKIRTKAKLMANMNSGAKA